jgi:methionyl-tRNA formyltransferase
MGTPVFACPSLEALYQAGHALTAVVTRPDRPAGRGRLLEASPVKRVALRLDVPVLQPQSARDPEFAVRLSAAAPELAVVVAYGQILPPEILRIPRCGCVNLHPSLLPHLRGAAPIPWAILRGETTTGVTTFFLNEAMDAGDIILQREVPIAEDEDAGSLSRRLANLGAAALTETISLVERGIAPRLPQDEKKVTLAPKIRKGQLVLDWTKDARQLANEVRAFSPEPGAQTVFRGQALQILKSHPEDSAVSRGRAGEIVEADGKRGILLVRTGQGELQLLTVKPAGKRTMAIRDFINGYRPRPSEVLTPAPI